MPSVQILLTKKKKKKEKIKDKIKSLPKPRRFKIGSLFEYVGALGMNKDRKKNIIWGWRKWELLR